MLHLHQIQVETGRAVGGDFMRITHLPTGISRTIEPPLGKNAHSKRLKMLKEIEEELLSKD